MNAVFVYQCQDCGTYWTVYTGQPLQCSCGSTERTHLATVDPAVIIMRGLNSVEGFRDMILGEME